MPHLPGSQTINWQACNQPFRQRGQFPPWLDKGMNGLASDAATQFGLAIRGRFGRSLCRATGIAESMLRLVEPDRAVPCFSTAFPPAGTHPGATKARVFVFAGGQYRHQDDGRRRMDGDKAWR